MTFFVFFKRDVLLIFVFYEFSVKEKSGAPLATLSQGPRGSWSSIGRHKGLSAGQSSVGVLHELRRGLVHVESRLFPDLSLSLSPTVLHMSRLGIPKPSMASRSTTRLATSITASTAFPCSSGAQLWPTGALHSSSRATRRSFHTYTDNSDLAIQLNKNTFEPGAVSTPITSPPRARTHGDLRLLLCVCMLRRPSVADSPTVTVFRDEGDVRLCSPCLTTTSEP